MTATVAVSPLSWVLMLGVLSLPLLLPGKDEQQRLQRIDKQIDEVENRVRDRDQRIDNLQTELARLEQRMEQIRRDQLKTRQQRLVRQRELNQLHHKRGQLIAAQERMHAEVVDIVYIAYRRMLMPKLRLIAVDQAQTRLARYYYNWFEGDKTRQLQRYQALLEEVQNNNRKLLRQRQQIDADNDRLARAARELRNAGGQRTALLEEQEKKRGIDLSALRRLKHERRVLRGLVERLTRKSGGRSTTFEALYGRLPRPLDGELLHAFGTPRGGGLSWDGQVIKVPERTAMRAVADGTVAYAGLLKPVGYIVIVDHGDRYLTLYSGGTVSVSQQQWVAAGHQLMQIRSSGVGKPPQAYFGIRHNSQPVDPAKWLARDW